MDSLSEIINEIEDLFLNRGVEQYYGERISQYEHAAQSFLIAQRMDFDLAFQVAAFLHDIGHLIETDDFEGSEFGNANHDIIAEQWLSARGFPEKVIELIKNHVEAKRYLCLKSPAYYKKLSDASKATLEMQGGFMTKEEAVSFEKNLFYKEIITLRQIDDEAKMLDVKIPPIDYFLACCFQLLRSAKNNKLNLKFS